MLCPVERVVAQAVEQKRKFSRAQARLWVPPRCLASVLVSERARVAQAFIQKWRTFQEWRTFRFAMNVGEANVRRQTSECGRNRQCWTSRLARQESRVHLRYQWPRSVPSRVIEAARRSWHRPFLASSGRVEARTREMNVER